MMINALKESRPSLLIYVFMGLKSSRLKKNFPPYPFIPLNMRLSVKIPPVYVDNLVIAGTYFMIAVPGTVLKFK